MRLTERCESLVSWIAFVNGRQDSPPEVPPLIAQSAKFCEDIRNWANEQLAKIADNRSEPFWFIDGPPRRWMIARSQIREIEAGSAHLSLIRALTDAGADRVRRCEGCQSLFVSMNSRSTACSRKCSNRVAQRAFYKRYQTEERKRKREEYDRKKKAEQRWKAFLLERHRRH